MLRIEEKRVKLRERLQIIMESGITRQAYRCTDDKHINGIEGIQ